MAAKRDTATGKISGVMRLALVDSAGKILKEKCREFDAYSLAELDYLFAVKGKELCRDYLYSEFGAEGYEDIAKTGGIPYRDLVRVG